MDWTKILLELGVTAGVLFFVLFRLERAVKDNTAETAILRGEVRRLADRLGVFIGLTTSGNSHDQSNGS
jgi:hypothetical protein